MIEGGNLYLVCYTRVAGNKHSEPFKASSVQSRSIFVPVVTSSGPNAATALANSCILWRQPDIDRVKELVQQRGTQFSRVTRPANETSVDLGLRLRQLTLCCWGGF